MPSFNLKAISLKYGTQKEFSLQESCQIICGIKDGRGCSLINDAINCA